MLFLSHLDQPFAASPLSPQPHPVVTETKNSEMEVKSDDMTSALSRIIDVPVEILVEVLKHLECRYILRCMLLSRFFRDIITTSLELQYIIQLSLTNQINNPNCLLPTSTKLSLLLDRRERWKTLNWTSTTRVPLRGGCHAYELVGGVFAKSVNFGGGGGAWGAAGSRHFVAALLPTRDSTTPCKIERQDLGVPARDFAIDPSQDLIALVDIDDTIHTNTRIQVHLRTISTNTPHKLARVPTLIAPIPFQIGACFIQIVKDVIGMFFWLHGPSLVIWNWRSGELLVVYLPGGLRSLSLLNGGLMGGGAPATGGVEDGGGQTGQLERLAREGGVGELNPGTWDFAFLSERAFMLTILGGHGSIYIYTFKGGKPEQEMSSKGSQYLAAPRHVATLHLPALQDRQEIHHFSTHSAPFLGGDPANPGEGRLFQQRSNNDDEIHGQAVEESKDSNWRIQLEDRGTRRIMKPFFSSQENRVHLMSFHYGITGPRFHLFVKNDFLLGIAEKFGESGNDDTLDTTDELIDETRVKEIEWEDWGPTNTRFLEHNLSFQWLRYCHGQRIVLPPIPDQASPHGVSKLCVIDFNVHPSRLDPSDPSELKREDLNSTYEVVKTPSIIRAGNLFKEDVQSWLPYSRATRVGMFSHYSGFMIDDERLVGMKASMSVAEGDLSDIDVFTF